jgi:hypothetical protein
MHALEMPSELGRLIAAGAWPRSSHEANRQDLETDSVVQRLVPGHDQLFLYPPPFATVAECIARGEQEFWGKWGSLDQIDPHRTQIIGDFGLGSDTAIALDYRSPESTAVIRLAWEAEDRKTHWEKRTRWVPFFATFAEFASAFDIERRMWR